MVGQWVSPALSKSVSSLAIWGWLSGRVMAESWVLWSGYSVSQKSAAAVGAYEVVTHFRTGVGNNPCCTVGFQDYQEA